MKKIVAGVLSVCLLFVLSSCQASAEWQEQYDLGMRYLTEGNYSEAIIAFTAAIEIDERQAAAYAGRGDAYLGAAMYEEAIEDYQEAIRRDKKEMEYYEHLSNGYVGQGDLDAALNALRDGYSATGDPLLLERMISVQHAGTFQGGGFAWGEDYLNSPISDAIVTLRDVRTGVVMNSFRTDRDGLYQGFAIEGEYEFLAHSEGRQSALIYKEIGLDETVYVENLYLLPEDESGTGAIRGTIYSAVNGRPLSGVEVWAVSNWNQRESESDSASVFHAVSESDGSYVLPEQKSGYYTVFAAYEGYMTSSVNVVASGSYEANWDIMLSPHLAEGEELRVVLTWGATPRDLDSHLIMDYRNWEDGFFSGNDTYYGSMSTYDGYDMVSQLDVDDTSSYGPETITVYKQGHSFVYVVHDYTNRSTPDSSELSESEARVVVYGTNGILGVFYVPLNMQGNVWVVFSIDSNGILHSVGELTTSNR